MRLQVFRVEDLRDLTVGSWQANDNHSEEHTVAEFIEFCAPGPCQRHPIKRCAPKRSDVQSAKATSSNPRGPCTKNNRLRATDRPHIA